MKLNTSSNAGILIIIALKLIIKIIGYFLDRMQNIDHIRQKAEKGDVESQFGMAWSYAKGLGGVEENHQEARHCIEQVLAKEKACKEVSLSKKRTKIHSFTVNPYICQNKCVNFEQKDREQ